jgi:hypothetical protein
MRHPNANRASVRCSLRPAWNVNFYPISVAAETSDASKSWDTSGRLSSSLAHLDPRARKPDVSCVQIYPGNRGVSKTPPIGLDHHVSRDVHPNFLSPNALY